ncbi:MAG: hypothetical protein HC902_13140, partial [Calothrix sp. SM1_5_4]|nr:hypothetical protein [Calothrix sp. SM1_5_4]
NDQGYTFRRQLKGGGSHSRNDHFTVDNLHCMLRNKAYIGLKVYNHRGQTHEAKAVWDGIVDPVIFERVGKILDENRHRVKHRHSRGALATCYQESFDVSPAGALCRVSQRPETAANLATTSIRGQQNVILHCPKRSLHATRTGSQQRFWSKPFGMPSWFS